MPCDCDGFPEPSLWERVKRIQDQYDDLYRCHQEVVAERDDLKKRLDTLVDTLRRD